MLMVKIKVIINESHRKKLQVQRKRKNRAEWCQLQDIAEAEPIADTSAQVSQLVWVLKSLDVSNRLMRVDNVEVAWQEREHTHF